MLSCKNTVCRDIIEHQHNRFKNHSGIEQWLDGLKQLGFDNPLYQLVLVLKMIVKRGADNSGLVRYLFNCNLIDWLFAESSIRLSASTKSIAFLPCCVITHQTPS